MGLVDADGRAIERLRMARFHRLAARTYPAVDVEQLALVSDWITFLFFYDDQCDTPDVVDPTNRERIVAIERRLLELGHGGAPRTDDPPLCRSLGDILHRLARWAAPGWLARLGAHLEEYIHGCRWERRLRTEGRIPGIDTYARLRPMISAVFPCIDLAGALIAGCRPEMADEPIAARLSLMANDYISWVNDIHGLDKEVREGTTSNLVLVLGQEYRLDRADAIDRAVELCNAKLRDFLSLARRLERGSDPCKAAFVAALEAWMRGNLDWYSETMRYGGGDRVEARPLQDASAAHRSGWRASDHPLLSLAHAPAQR